MPCCSQGCNFDKPTKHIATSLVKKIKNYEFICMLVLWYKILSKVDAKKFNISLACESLIQVNAFLKEYWSDDHIFGPQKIKNKQFSYESDDQPIENQEIKFKDDCFFRMLDTTICQLKI